MRVEKFDGKAYVRFTEVLSVTLQLAERDRRIEKLEKLLAEAGISVPAQVSVNANVMKI